MQTAFRRPLGALSPAYILLFSAWLFLVSGASATTLEPLKYNAEQQKTAAEVVTQLSSRHYRSQAFDDAMSSRYLDNLLKNLDPGKSFFFQADIDEFEKHRNRFDDYLKKGDLKAGFDIFDRYRQRVVTRLESVISILESEDSKFDFDIEESLVIDWDKAVWPVDKKSADQHWHKRIKSGLLSLKLTDKSLEESKEILLKRFQGQLRRVKQQNDEEAFEVVINALTTLYDPHTNYLGPRTLENFNINMSLSLEGIGAVLQTEDEYTKIMRLVPAGPADKQGDLRPADRIISVGQGEQGELIDVVGWRLDEVVQLIRGPKSTIVRLEVLPANAAAGSATRTINIKRETVKLEEQAAQKSILDLSDGEKSFRLGVIDIPTFYMDFEAYRKRDPNYTSTTRDVYRLLNELEEAEVDGIIIDLRNNGGGSLQEATTLTDLFIDQGPVVQIRQTNESISRNFRSHSRAAYRGPIVVLINRLSASASEIFAGAIQDYGRGIIIGTQSFGKGSVQSLVPLNRGQLKITESKFYRISGESTQHRGVVPDLTLPSLVNVEDVGESTYDNALPWDRIHAVPHARYFDIASLLPNVDKRHAERVKADPDFSFMDAQTALMQETTNRKSVSLRKATRLKEQQDLEQRTLALENRRRAAKGLKAYKSYAEIRAEEEAEDEEANETGQQSAQKMDPANDPFLNEAGHVLIDFINQLESQESARVANF